MVIKTRGGREPMLSEIQFCVFVNSFLLLLVDKKQVTPGIDLTSQSFKNRK